MICLDSLLYGTPAWEDVVEFFRNGDFCDERYAEEAIEKHLQTESQRQEMFVRRMTIVKILNGRYEATDSSVTFVDRLFEDWNAKLGFKHFGH